MKTRELAFFSILLGLNLGCSGDVDDDYVDEVASFEPTPRRPAPPPPVAPTATATAVPTAQPAPAATPVIFTSQTSPPVPPPPPALPIVRALDLTVWTGGDDLRGGNDNAYFTLFPDVGGQLVVSVNDGFGLAGNSNRTVRLTIPGGLLLDNLGYFTICGTMTGGIGGDNWNIDRIRVLAVSEVGSLAIFDTLGTPPPLARLTSDQRCTPAYAL